MSFDLNGTVALVTGASSGIGHATALRLAGLGAAVAVVARRKDRLDALVAEIERAGGTALAIPADITDRASAEASVAKAAAQLGRIDILVNNAGVMNIGRVADNTVESWEQMIALNQQALLYVTKAALPHLQRPRGATRAVSRTSSTSRPMLVASPHRTSPSTA
jgi:NADP-dependent 3-hydroxy acid dehydrogenase YdfG